MSEPLRLRFGQNLKRLRGLAAISQEELAFRAGLHRTEISRMERGEQMPRLEAILKLAGALEVTSCELLKGLSWAAGWSVPGRFMIDGVPQRPPLDR
jgi:transcriptional regulator with XRE-family HTH domain